MRCILKQLSYSNSDLSIREPIVKKYKNLREEADDDGCDELAKLTVEECVELILGLLESNPATIIIDALDECDPARRYELFMAFDGIIAKSTNVVKIFVSSRDDSDIVSGLDNCPNVLIHVSDNSEDISHFIRSQVDRSIKDNILLHGDVSDELKSCIVEVLTDRAQGM
jgi:hypothetical protein